MMLRKLVIVLTLALAACQPPPPYVIAVMDAGELVFHLRQRGLFTDRIFGWDDDRVIVRQFLLASGGHIVWRLRQEGARGACKARQTFPVRLGESRCNYGASGNAAAIVPGPVYDIRLSASDCEQAACTDQEQWWSGEVVGRFRLGKNGRVINFRPD